MNPIRVLYVDDSPFDRDLVRFALNADNTDFDLVEAASRTEFEAHLRKEEYDLVLSDFNILGFEGLQVFDKVHNYNPRLPVIILTGTGSEEVAVEAMKRGVSDYVIKTPQQIRKLPQIIRSALEKQHLKEVREEAEKLQDAIYRIAQAADHAGNLESLYPAIHTIIQEIMAAGNFYIAIYDEKNDLLSFPYSVDQIDYPVAHRKPGKGLTEYVLRTKKSLLCDKALNKTLVQQGEIELVGIPSPIWLGIPLMVAGKAIGVMVVQDYENAAAYGVREQRILEFVSSQAAMAIQRKWAEETLRSSQQETAHANHLLLALSHASQTVQRAQTTKDVYRAIQNQVSRLGYYVVGYELEPDGHSLRLAYVNYQQELLRKSEKIIGFSLDDFRIHPNPDSAFFRVINQRETVFVVDIIETVASVLPRKLRALAKPLADLLKLENSILAPMVMGDEVIGILSIAGQNLTSADIPAIRTFAQQAANSIQNAQLLENLQMEISNRQQTATALRESEQRLRFHMENSPMAVVEWDSNFVITRWTVEAERIFGWSQHEVLGRRIMDLQLIYEEDIPIVQQTMERLTNGSSSYVVSSNRNYTKEGKVIYCEWYNSIFQNTQGEMISVLSQVLDITERKQGEKALEQSNEQLRTLTAYWQSAIEAERAHISREIHDEFGQSMTALKMDLTWLTRHLKLDEEIDERIRGMNTLIDESITLMRRIATDLRPNLLDDLGLNAALQWQTQEFTKRTGIQNELSLPENDLGLDPALNTTIFRIFQESLTNVTRHSKANLVNISFQEKDNNVILVINDNGRGISKQERDGAHSLGLLGIRERAALWGGVTTIIGEPGTGTTVTVSIPRPLTSDGGE